MAPARTGLPAKQRQARAEDTGPCTLGVREGSCSLSRCFLTVAGAIGRKAWASIPRDLVIRITRPRQVDSGSNNGLTPSGRALLVAAFLSSEVRVVLTAPRTPR
jgi:hypothetical protein